MSWSVYRIESMADVRRVFPDGKADPLNLLFCSTSGVHGSYMTLDEVQKYFDDPEAFDRDENGGEAFVPGITLTIVHTRTVVIASGTVDIVESDIPYLRGLVRSTIKAVREAQEGNT